jgi:hypothetical protein
MRLWYWVSARSDSRKLDIEATNETAGADSTAGWPEPIAPTLPTPPAFASPPGLVPEELTVLREAYDAKACLYRE